MNLNLTAFNGNEVGRPVDPTAAVVIADAVAFQLMNNMGMAAENIIGSAQAGIANGSFRHFIGHSQPMAAMIFNPLRDQLAFWFQMLDNIVENSG